MKRLLYSLTIGTLLLGVISCKNSGNSDGSDKKTKERTTIEFPETNYDFGNITAGEKVTHVFKFKNTGDVPLEVTQAMPSCGCTIPEWTEDPIEPGEEGKIEVMFNSEGRSGMQHKSITVVANTKPATHILTFTANVLQPTSKK